MARDLGKHDRCELHRAVIPTIGGIWVGGWYKDLRKERPPFATYMNYSKDRRAHAPAARLELPRPK